MTAELYSRSSFRSVVEPSLGGLVNVPRHFDTKVRDGKDVELRPINVGRAGQATNRAIMGAELFPGTSRNSEVLCIPDARDGHVAIVPWNSRLHLL